MPQFSAVARTVDELCLITCYSPQDLTDKIYRARKDAYESHKNEDKENKKDWSVEKENEDEENNWSNCEEGIIINNMHTYFVSILTMLYR